MLVDEKLRPSIHGWRRRLSSHTSSSTNTCTSCGAGKKDTGCTTCANCDAGRYQTSTAHTSTSCTVWSMCGAGKKQSVAPSLSVNRACVDCATGKYQLSTTFTETSCVSRLFFFIKLISLILVIFFSSTNFFLLPPLLLPTPQPLSFLLFRIFVLPEKRSQHYRRHVPLARAARTKQRTVLRR